MTPHRTAMATLAALTTLVATLIAATPARAASVAEDPAPVVVAQDSTPPPSTVPARVIGIDADVVNGLTITGHAGRAIEAAAKGYPTRTANANHHTPVVLRNLAAGVKYTITVGGRAIGTATPVAQVGATSGLLVTTTTRADTVDARWTYAATRAQGAVSFTVTATALAPDGTPDPSPAATTSITTATTSGEITGLNPKARYRFSVLAHNSASTGRPSVATMTDTLAALTGLGDTPTPVATAPVAPTPPPPTPTPGTQTIYVCPDGFTDIGGAMCQKTLPYTYHQEPAGPAPLLDSYQTDAGACPAGYNLEDYGWVKYCRLYGPVPMKDVKDPTPTGFVDDGSKWISIVPKVAVQVPA